MNRTGSSPAFPIVVVGAGLTGLTASWRLHQAGHKVVVLEASEVPGGVIQSQWVNKVLIEKGPHTFQSSAEPIFRLCDELGLSPQATSPLAKKRFVWWQQQLCAVPDSPLSFLTTPLLSASAKWRLLQEPFIPPKKAMAEVETLGEWACRRLGPEVLTTLLGPFVSGVYAGNPASLSASATFPSLSCWEAEQGSVVRGAFHQLSMRRKAVKQGLAPKKRPYGLYNFENGMATLPNTLAERLPDVRFNHRLLGLQRQGDGSLQVRVHAPMGEKNITASQVVLTLPAHQLSSVLPLGTLPEPLAVSSCIPYAPMTVVHVVAKQADVRHPLDGFGFLVPRATGVRILGSIWTSRLFPNRAPEGQHLLSVFIGGATDPTAMALNNVELENLIRLELGPMIGLEPSAELALVAVRYPQAIPQYTVGHQARVAQLMDALNRFSPRVHAGGNYTHGVALHDCITEGERLAQQVMHQAPGVSTAPLPAAAMA